MSASDRAAPSRDCGDDAAAYVLGALEPAEAQTFAHHMQGCAACRDEVAALAPVLRVLPDSGPRYEVSASLRRRVMLAVSSEPTASSARRARPRAGRRRVTLRDAFAFPRPAVAAALALVFAFAIGGAGELELGSRGSPARVIAASVGDAQLQIAGGHGELIVDHLPAAPPNRVYELWLQRGERRPAPSTLFAVTSQGTAVVGLPGDLAGVTRVLVTLEPTGGSRVTKSRALIVTRT